MITFQELHEAVQRRSLEWDTQLTRGLLFRCVELGGEAGEALNAAKKIVREREGLRGSKSSKADLAQELADTVICAARIAAGEGIDLGEAVVSTFNAKSIEIGCKTLIGDFL